MHVPIAMIFWIQEFLFYFYSYCDDLLSIFFFGTFNGVAVLISFDCLCQDKIDYKQKL